MTSDASDYRDVQESADVTWKFSGVAFWMPSGKKAMQGGYIAVPPPDHQPKSATTELGDARRAETGVGLAGGPADH